MRKPWLRINVESSGSLWNWMVTSEPPDTTLNLSLEPRYCPITCDVRSWPSNSVRMSLWRMFKLQTSDGNIYLKYGIKPKTELNTNCYNQIDILAFVHPVRCACPRWHVFATHSPAPSSSSVASQETTQFPPGPWAPRHTKLRGEREGIIKTAFKLLGQTDYTSMFLETPVATIWKLFRNLLNEDFWINFYKPL